MIAWCLCCLAKIHYNYAEIAYFVKYFFLKNWHLRLDEVDGGNIEPLWLRGGFPDSFLAATDADSLAQRESFIRTYLERDVPMFGPRIPAETLRRLWTKLGGFCD